ncbi:cupin domain-containing protein [Novosphingobium sp.]|uniref:cupin domain-containing protein n=1 Tax=Novosphingobium sp. TaxID=1874826 RepID=UPI003B521AB5
MIVQNDRTDRENVVMRGGPGMVCVRHFGFDGAGAPARFLILEIPPGAAEGVHVHRTDDANGIGAFDEFYYIIAGNGLMTLGPDTFAVGPGDYVHAPLDMPRGLANASPALPLKVHLTVVLREPVRPGDVIDSKVASSR